MVRFVDLVCASPLIGRHCTWAELIADVGGLIPVLQKLYAVCDIGIVITKELGKKKHFSGEYPGTIPLPAAFYKPIDVAEGEEPPVAKVTFFHS